MSLPFPQNLELVEQFDRILRLRMSEVRDYTYEFHRRWEKNGVMTMRGTGWAVRPFLVPADRLDFIAASFHCVLNALRNAMREEAGRPGAVSYLLPMHPEFEECVDIVDGLWSAGFLSHFRPDGFLFEDRFVLSEINYGNGIFVSCGYTEATADYWQNHPVLKQLGWDVARLHRRPLPWLINAARRFCRPVHRPTVALLAHSEEWKALEELPKRVLDQIHFVCDQFRRAGLAARIVHEQDVAVNRSGQLCFDEDGEHVDLLMFITVGTTFMDEPGQLKMGGPFAHFGKARIGDTWVLKPLAGLLVDKGALPWLGQLGCNHSMRDGFRFEIANTEYPRHHEAARYDDRENWVIKRSFDGKDTHPGIMREYSQWQAVVEKARADYAYVAQSYVSLPRANVPVFVDEDRLEWISSRVELSTFVYDGAFGGAGGRHAPDAEGIVMTDFPADYGYTTVFAV